MDVETLLTELSLFLGMSEPYVGQITLPEREIVAATKLADHTFRHRREQGVYVYATDQNDEVLYIGKGWLGWRVWSHLRAPNPDRDAATVFPNHGWKDASRVPQDLRQAVSEGRFNVWMLPVVPGECADFVEVVAQSISRSQGWDPTEAQPPDRLSPRPPRPLSTSWHLPTVGKSGTSPR